MLPLNSRARHPKVSSAALTIVGPLLGLVYVILLPVIGVITIVPLMLYRVEQAVSQAVRGGTGRHSIQREFYRSIHTLPEQVVQ